MSKLLRGIVCQEFLSLQPAQNNNGGIAGAFDTFTPVGNDGVDAYYNDENGYNFAAGGWAVPELKTGDRIEADFDFTFNSTTVGQFVRFRPYVAFVLPIGETPIDVSTDGHKSLAWDMTADNQKVFGVVVPDTDPLPVDFSIRNMRIKIIRG